MLTKFPNTSSSKSYNWVDFATKYVHGVPEVSVGSSPADLVTSCGCNSRHAIDNISAVGILQSESKHGVSKAFFFLLLVELVIRRVPVP